MTCRIGCLALLCALLAACTNLNPTATAGLTTGTLSPVASVTAPVSVLSATERIQPSPSPSLATEDIQLSTPVLTQTPLVTPTPSLTSMVPISLASAASLDQVAELQFSPWELVMAVAWAPDGGTLAVSAGEAIYLYSAGSLEQFAKLHAGAFTHSLDFSPDGGWLAAGSRDGLVRLWNLSVLRDSGNPTLARVIEAHKKGVNSVEFMPDSSALASGGNDAVARIWDQATGEMLGTMIGGTFAVPGIAFTPDGTTLAVVNGEVVRLREVGSESILGTFLAATSLYSLAFRPDGALLAAGGSDNLIRLWDPKDAFRTGSETYPDSLLLEGHHGTIDSYQALIWAVEFSPEGDLLASAGGDGTVRVWDASSGAILATLAAHPRGATCVAFSPAGNLLVTGGLDGTARLWGVVE